MVKFSSVPLPSVARPVAKVGEAVCGAKRSRPDRLRRKGRAERGQMTLTETIEQLTRPLDVRPWFTCNPLFSGYLCLHMHPFGRSLGPPPSSAEPPPRHHAGGRSVNTAARGELRAAPRPRQPNARAAGRTWAPRSQLVSELTEWGAGVEDAGEPGREEERPPAGRAEPPCTLAVDPRGTARCRRALEELQ